MDPSPIESLPPPTTFTSVATARPAPRPLISDELRRPGWLWLTHVVPAILAFLSGAYTYSIVAGEFTPGEKQATLAQAIALIAVALFSATLALAKQRHGKLLTNTDCAGLLVMAASVMATGFTFTFLTIPDSLPDWIAGREELICRFACLGMLGVFYCLLLLSSYPLRRHGAIEFAKAVGFVVLSAVAFFVFCQFELATHISLPEWLMWTVVWVAMIVGGTVVTGAIIRLTLIAYLAVRRTKPTFQQILMFIIALAAPICGLLLNRKIPFPTDFQAPVIYLLTVVNCGVLMLPVVRSIFWHRTIWLAQCVMFPFSAYFFVTFLPWMPLSIFAMVAIGSGFLMLTPIVLGIVHGYRIVDGYRDEIRDGVAWKPALMGLAAVLFLPAALGWNMWQDRQTLNQALVYIYSPDYRKDVAFKGDLGRLQNSLQHLRDMKHGIFLPFISPAYNAIVFHGLVLPDAKIEYLQTAFFGTPISSSKTGLMMRSNSEWGQRASGNWTTSPPTGAVLTDVKVITHPEAGFSVSRLTIEMANTSGGQNEFVTTLHIPEGVYVSDFGLVINNELVPARIVEKKTALWVFEKIAAYRRDPGLLIYKSRTELEMRVFPVTTKETRRAEIELIHPNSTPLSITIGNRSVELNPEATPQKMAVTACTTPSGSIAIAEGTSVPNFAIHRRPYLYVLIDCSRGAGYTAASLTESLREAKQAFPDAEVARVSAINYEARDLVSDLTPVGQLDAAAIQKDLLPLRGGFLEDRFLKRGLLQASDFMQKGTSEALLRPQFVIISSQTQSALRDEGGLENFLRLAPDARIIYSQKSVASPQKEDMITHESEQTSQPADILLWQWADHYAVSLAEARAVATFPGNISQAQPLLYQSTTGKFIAADSNVVAATASRFADGVKTWAAEDEATLNPSLIQDGASALIGLSKQTRILVPDSSFIAVESSSQWRIMEEKEKLKLKNNQAFELEEPTATPEPATWIMLILGLAMLGLVRSKLRHKVLHRAAGILQ